MTLINSLFNITNNKLAMKKTATGITAIVLLLISLSAAAEKGYITDSVTIDIYSLQNETGLLVTRLGSGTQIEIVSQEGEYTQINTLDKKSGWVKTIYISKDKPYSVKYLQLRGKHTSVSKDLEEAYERLSKFREMEKSAKTAGFTKRELNKSAKKIKKLSADLKSRDTQLKKANELIAQLENKTPNTAPAQDETSPGSDDTLAEPESSSAADHPSSLFNPTGFMVPFLWTVIAIVFFSMLAFMGGMKWLDYRIRKRHGGVRIY